MFHKIKFFFFFTHLLLSEKNLFSDENFLLYDLTQNKIIIEMGDETKLRCSPCSTFKIVLSLAGFESNVLIDKYNPLWPFQVGYSEYLPTWKQAQNPEMWMKNSCIWYSQLLVKNLGYDSMQSFLTLFDYGNKDMSGGLDRFWLSSTLKISPFEQLNFINKMLNNELFISSRTWELTKDLLFQEEIRGGKFYGKTGLGNEKDHQIGWFVGWFTIDDRSFSFVYLIKDFVINPAARIPRVKELLFSDHELN